MTSNRILVVEDDRSLRKGISENLEQEGYAVVTAVDGDAAARLLSADDFDLVILDLMLPHKSGLDVLRDLRSLPSPRGRTPVLILTAKDSENDKVLGLELGADDYMTKPFGLREFLARVRLRLRARHVDAQQEATPERFVIGDAEIDLEAYELRRGDQKLALSQKEASMLALLWLERGKVVRRERFLDAIWGTRFVTSRTIDTHVFNLRKKLERDPKDPRFLMTVHGIGYKLDT